VTSWAIYALVVLLGPLVRIARWFLIDTRRGRTQARFITKPGNDYSVAAIAALVEQECADTAVKWPADDPDDDTVVLPAIPSDEPRKGATRQRHSVHSLVGSPQTAQSVATPAASAAATT
jgi:hypothetical protein